MSKQGVLRSPLHQRSKIPAPRSRKLVRCGNCRQGGFVVWFDAFEIEPEEGQVVVCDDYRCLWCGEFIVQYTKVQQQEQK